MTRQFVMHRKFVMYRKCEIEKGRQRKMRVQVALIVSVLIFFPFAYPADMKVAQGDFGRLFTEPQSRAQLDRYKHTGTLYDGALPALPVQASVQQQVSTANKTVKLIGYILGEQGQHKVWLESDSNGINSNGINSNSNEHAALKNTAHAGKPSESSHQVPVRARHQLRLLKPGQVWLLDERKVAESYLLKKQEAEKAENDLHAANKVDNKAETNKAETKPGESDSAFAAKQEQSSKDLIKESKHEKPGS
jgi:hypothetical protein